MPKKKTAPVPIADNADVKAFLTVLQDNNAPALGGFLAVLSYVGAMEKQLETAVTELAAMRRDLAEAEKRNHPVRNVLQKAVNTAQAQVADLRERLTELKTAIIDGCKNAVAAFKEKGVAALDNIARFFKVKPLLEAMHKAAHRAAQSADRAVSNIEAFSAEYHEAGRHLKNMGRALQGKEAAQEVKPQGKVSKTVSAPFRATRSCFKTVRNLAVAAVGKLNRLEEQARKPSINKTITDLNKQIAAQERAAPKRSRSRNAEI